MMFPLFWLLNVLCASINLGAYLRDGHWYNLVVCIFNILVAALMFVCWRKSKDTVSLDKYPK